MNITGPSLVLLLVTFLLYCPMTGDWSKDYPRIQERGMVFMVALFWVITWGLTFTVFVDLPQDLLRWYLGS